MSNFVVVVAALVQAVSNPIEEGYFGIGIVTANEQNITM
jgi:hypothetical protein